MKCRRPIALIAACLSAVFAVDCGFGAEPLISTVRSGSEHQDTSPSTEHLTERDILARQAALDRTGFSPGVIDGLLGPKTTLALREFQEARGLNVSGEFDAPSVDALRIAATEALAKYTITAADLRDIGPVPKDWNEKAKLERLSYESLTALLAERGHCSPALLANLNPGVKFAAFKTGDVVTLPNVVPAPLPEAATLEVDLENKVVRARNAAGRTIARFPCSIAARVEKRPQGAAHVVTVAMNPVYQFDPQLWPEVKNVKSKLLIPAGPRNPVGLCWIGLSLPGYGIHGTPNPELIGKTGSHGCIRLTNWDAVRLGKMVRAGIAVHFVGGER
jgi:lipoprotein-anchoring transpeptidase ErfK/SrfK